VTLRFRLKLRTQLVIAMIACVLATATIAIIASIVLEDIFVTSFTDTLSPAARKLNDDIDALRVPTDYSAVPELMQKGKAFNKDSENYGLIITGIIGGASILVGILIALIIAPRIGKPLDAVSVAAQRVADGDLTARIDAKAGGVGETIKLINSFNQMATSLENYQRQSIESSAAIAHELRTPLTVLQGRLQGMIEGVFETKPRDLEGLIGQVNSLSRIVSDLNIVSLAQAGRLTVHQEPVWLEEIVASLIHTVLPDLEAAGLVIETDLQPANGLADPSRVQQATLALIDNVKRHGAAGGSIRIETGIEKRQAFIRVLDRGPGLAPEIAARIFEPFSRGEGSRSRETGGTGLGLSVVASIASAHGGTVSASPREGGGTAFEMKLLRS
jgi:two-component system, OmpR family, sensor histidine kinase AdeS